MNPMIDASDVSLNSTMNCVTSDGIMLRSACGSTTKRMLCVPESPTAVAASTWPRGTDWMPARTISPRYAASKITNAVSATPNSGMLVLRTMGMMNHIQKITMTSGTPRKNSTYSVAGSRIHHWGARRPIPTKMPSANPSAIAGMARRRVPPANWPMPRKPWSIRNGRFRQRTSKSLMPGTPSAHEGRAPHFPPPPTGGDQAGNGRAALHPRHDSGDRCAHRQIDDRARGQRLERLGGVRLDLTRLERQLRDADREGDRGVLQEVERLGGAGRDDQPQGHGQEHVA